MLFVSILINNYNYRRYLATSIESALAQEYPHKEVIVVDDGSTDGSQDIIRSYGDRIVPVFQQNGGQASAFNAGFQRAKGDVLFLLDSDDAFLPGKIATVVRSYEAFEIGWCYDKATYVSGFVPKHRPTYKFIDAGRAMVRGKFPKLPVPTSCLSFHRTVLEKILPMPTTDGIGLSDNYLKFAAAYLAKGFLLDDTLTFQLLHANNRYTRRWDARKTRGNIMRATGFHLAQRYPELRIIGMHLLAGGMASQDVTLDSVRRDLGTYARSDVFGRFAVCRCLVLLMRKMLVNFVRKCASYVSVRRSVSKA